MKEEKEFRSDLWKKLTSYRNKVAKNIIRQNCLFGKSKSEIIKLFGEEENYYDLDEWSYFVKKNILGGETFLLVHFNGERVESQKLYTIYNLGNETILTL